MAQFTGSRSDCINHKPDSINIYSLKNAIESHVRLITDIIGYTMACGYDIEVFSAFNLDTKEHHIFGIHENIFDDDGINQITADSKPHPDAPSQSQILQTAIDNPQLTLALSDFREAIRQPSFSVFHGYRAIESLRYAAPQGIRQVEKQWEWLLSSLKIKKSTKDKLLRMGGGEQRHGKISPSSWGDRKFAMQIAWQAIQRFVYFHQDRAKLDNCSEI